MKKKYLNAILFSALIIGATGMFTSCKDYDDDIDDLQEQLNKKASLEDLTAKVGQLEASITAAKSEMNAIANSALEKAEEALAAAEKGGQVPTEILAKIDDAIAKSKEAVEAANKSSEAAEKAIKESAAAKDDVAKAKAEAAAAKADAAKAKENADAAAKTAQDAIAKVAGTKVDLDALKEAVKTVQAEIAAQLAKLASIDTINEKLAEVTTEIGKAKASGAENAATIAALQQKVETLTAELMQILGHRLASLSVIPTAHINGIAAITLTTLQYVPQVYYVNNHASTIEKTPTIHDCAKPWLDHKDAGAAVYVSSDKNRAYFHVSPSMGVQTDDIKTPSFNCIKSENITRAEIAANNSPIKPVSYKIEGDEMTVNFKKTVTDYIGTKGSAHADGKEAFYMASLKAPIADANLTEAEKEACKEVAVNSEYVRIEELLREPYLVNTRTDFSVKSHDFADEVQTDAKGKFYVHYHDSVCLYNSEAKEMIDYKVGYDQTVDLKKLVTVCLTEAQYGVKHNYDHVGHIDFTKEYKDYGLSFRFYLANAAYNTLGGPEGNSNKTDQQKFAQIDNAINGKMTSKVYTVNGLSATAVGREPIVRVELRDTVNNNLVAQRYIKFKWVKEAGQRPIKFSFNDELYMCKDYDALIGTQTMNEVIYHQAKEGGMTKQEFHAIYTDPGFDPNTGKEGEGVVSYIKNTEDGVDSYNILWALTHDDIVAKYPDWYGQEKLDFSKTFYWNDPTEAYPTLKITLYRTIYKPVFGQFGYDGRYWRTSSNYTVFNVNPIVFNTIENNPAWNDNVDHKNNPTCNIYTDLLNGFLDKDGKMPMKGAGYHLWYQDKGSKTPDAKIDYVGNYANEGVRFVFNLNQLNKGKNPDGKAYQFPYFDGTKVVMKSATLSPDRTQLFINGELAATIENALVNKCSNPENQRKGAITYNIKLEEVNNPAALPYAGADPTEAAKALVGQYVPVQLIADICAHAAHAKAHTEVIKSYDAFIIRPLTIGVGDTEDFTDATIDGSTIDVKGAFTYTCWNADDKGKFYTASNSKGATALQKDLWKFYECTPGEWMTNQARTNLKIDASGNLVPTAGVTDGPLPNNTTVTYDSVEETLTYYNHSGTPVNWNYKIFIPVKFGYKWQTETKTFEVAVKCNAGTPTK